MIYKPNFFVFTGGPGVGKTTLLRHLQASGERVVEETARAVIREQVEFYGTLTGTHRVVSPAAEPAPAEVDPALADVLHLPRREGDRGTGSSSA